MSQGDIDDWHEALVLRGQHREGPRGCGGGGPDTLPTRLASLLVDKGVPEDRSDERALAGIQALGEKAVDQALRAKNPWAELKTLASKPGVRFLWVKHDELMRQVRLRAENKFGISSHGKKKERQRDTRQAQVQLAPSHLTLLDGSFVDESGEAVKQIQFDEVKAHATGIALATVGQILPFLVEGKSLSLEPLAVITTEEVPHEQQGLLPVTQIRFPAEYAGTREPVLIQGSLIQLGDNTVTRRQDGVKPVIEANKTCTFKLVVFRDEWEASNLQWADLCKGPMKALFQNQEALTLCRGAACGGGCLRYHAPVDVECDSLITDLWDRRWAKTDGGGRVTPDKAGLFSVMMRVLDDAEEWIQGVSGQCGIYLEPRQQDGKGPAAEFGVIWLPQQGFKDAEHKKKTMQGAVAIARIGHRWGLRFRDEDMEAAFKELRPREQYSKISLDRIFVMYPLPHGTTRQGLQKSLKEWGWEAKPLQPTRGGAEGAGWQVGSGKAPPSMVLQGAHGDVVVTPVRTVQQVREPPKILSSFKTRSHLKQAASSTGTSSADPWLQHQLWQDNQHPATRSQQWLQRSRRLNTSFEPM